MPFNFIDIQEQAEEAYANSESRKTLPGARYNFFRNSKGYTNFESHALPRKKSRLPWEFYLSVHPEDLAQAFELVSNCFLLSHNGDFYFTVADPRVINAQGHIRNQITLYTFATEEGEMLQSPSIMYNHLRQIERDFRRAGIRMGDSTGHRDKIPGSSYIELGYYPEDGSVPPDDIHDLVQSQNNCYRLFTATNAPLRIDSSADEIKAFNAAQREMRN